MTGPGRSALDRSGVRGILYLLFFAAVFHRFYTHTIFYRDAFVYFAAVKQIIGEAWRSLSIQGWFPNHLLGKPLIGDIQSGFFYPLNVLFAFLPVGVALRLFILLHYPLAAWSMDRFLRGRGLTGEAAIAGALIFSMSGYLVSQHSTVTMLIGAAWAPLAMHYMDRALDEGIRRAPAVGAVLAMQVLGGDPQSAAVTAVILSAMAAASAFRKRSARSLAALAAAGVAAFFLSAAQILPTAELMMNSVRSGGLPLSELAKFSFHPVRLIEIIWPTPFGELWPKNFYWAEFATQSTRGMSDVPWSITEYLGLPALVLAGAGFFRARKFAWGAAALFFLVLALGDFTPVFPVLARLPLFDSFRYPEKYLAWFALFIAAGAGYGLAWLQGWIGEKPEAAARAAAIYLAAAIVFTIAGLLTFPLALDAFAGAKRELALEHIYTGARSFAVVNIVAGLLLLLLSKKQIAWRTAVSALFVLLAADLYLTNVTTMPAGAADLYSFPSSVAEVISPEGGPKPGEYRLWREKSKFEWGDPALDGMPGLLAQAIWLRDTLWPGLEALKGFETIKGWSPLDIAGGEFLDNLDSSQLAAFNTRYVIMPYGKMVGGPAARVIKRDPVRRVTLVELPGAFPRAYWIGKTAWAKDGAEAEEMMKKADLRSAVIITAPAREKPESSRGLVEAEILQYDPGRVLAEVDAPEDGWLVLSDRFYPGWRAAVDGVPSEILPANLLIRAVRVPAGKHEVEFAYRPLPLRIGVWISLISWIVLAVITARRRARV